jgi:hypothetical protein
MPEWLIIFFFEYLSYIPDRVIRRGVKDLCLLIVVPARERVFDDDSTVVLSCEEDIGPSGYDEKSEIMDLREHIRLMKTREVVLTRELIEILGVDKSLIARVVSDLMILFEKLGD